MSTLANWAASLDISTFLSLFLFFAIALHFFSSKPFKNLPPGPLNLPIVGYTPFVIGKNLGQVFVKLKKKYGDVVYLRLGSLPVVSLNSYDTIKEALLLNPHISLTRPTKFYARSYIFQELGISSENGKNWYDQRRFLMSALRDLGFGKENLENQIREEGLALVKDLQAHVGQPCDLQLLFQCATANIITMLMFGFRYNYEDPIIHSELSDQFKLLKYLSPLHILNGFPYLRLIIPASMSGMKEMEDSKNEIAKYMNSKIEDHSKTRNDIRDYTSIYLKKQKQDLDSGFQNTPFHSNNRNSFHYINLKETE